MADVKINVFISYSHEDEELRNGLSKHLKPLERQGKVETWYDKKIAPGIDWRSELDSQLNSADIILLLVSVDFVNSDFCYCVELQRAKERHEAGEARIIPIFLKSLDLDALEGTPLQALQGLPDPKKPVTKWDDQDEAFTVIAQKLRLVVNEVQQKKQARWEEEQAKKARLSPMRARVPDEHYVERDEAKRFLTRFDEAIKQPDGQPLLFNICGIGGVGKTTLLGRLQETHEDEADFLQVCFAKTPGIETPLKLMRKLHQQALALRDIDIETDTFTQKEQQFEAALFELTRQSVDGGVVSGQEARKITSWFEKFIWLGTSAFTSIRSKSKSFDFEAGFSASASLDEDVEGLQEWIERLVRNHPATKDNAELQALMLEPVSRLTQAFADSLMQTAQHRERSLILILDTYEKAQSYLNQWLWQYLIEDTSLYSAPVTLVVVGRRPLEADEEWRKLNQDRKLLYDVQLRKFSKSDTDDYLKKIGIKNGGTRAKIYRTTQGLPYYLDWVRKQYEQGEEPDFSRGNQAIAELLFQGALVS